MNKKNMTKIMELLMVIMIVLVMVVGCVKVYAFENLNSIQLTEEIMANEIKISNLETEQEHLHTLAETLRANNENNSNDELITSLQTQWNITNEKKILLKNYKDEMLALLPEVIEQEEEIKRQEEQKQKEAEEREAIKARINQDDLLLLAKVIYAEAAEGNLLDYQLVGNVVLNRVAASTFPNTIREVVYQGNGAQYACIKGNKFKGQPNQMALEVAESLLLGERYCPENVVFQAQFKQGNGIYKKIGVHYYCYGNI
jgi:spore germination cell wall hydrolase CwlJ-like protein